MDGQRFGLGERAIQEAEEKVGPLKGKHKIFRTTTATNDGSLSQIAILESLSFEPFNALCLPITVFMYVCVSVVRLYHNKCDYMHNYTPSNAEYTLRLPCDSAKLKRMSDFIAAGAMVCISRRVSEEEKE